MTERLPFRFSPSGIGKGNVNPLQCSCLENPRDGGAWWAAISGVAQSRTRLKQLSSRMISRYPQPIFPVPWRFPLWHPLSNNLIFHSTLTTPSHGQRLDCVSLSNCKAPIISGSNILCCKRHPPHPVLTGPPDYSKPRSLQPTRPESAASTGSILHPGHAFLSLLSLIILTFLPVSSTPQPFSLF